MDGMAREELGRVKDSMEVVEMEAEAEVQLFDGIGLVGPGVSQS